VVSLRQSFESGRPETTRTIMICDCLPIAGVLPFAILKSRPKLSCEKNLSADRPLNRRAQRASTDTQLAESSLFEWSIWTVRSTSLFKLEDRNRTRLVQKLNWTRFVGKSENVYSGTRTFWIFRDQTNRKSVYRSTHFHFCSLVSVQFDFCTNLVRFRFFSLNKLVERTARRPDLGLLLRLSRLEVFFLLKLGR